MTKEQRKARIAELERRYPRKYLEQSLSRDGLEWRKLTASNAASFDRKD